MQSLLLNVASQCLWEKLPVRIPVRCSPPSKHFLSEQFSPRNNDQSSECSLELLCFPNVRPTLARKLAPARSQSAESRSITKMLLPSLLTNQSARINQSWHSYQLCHIIILYCITYKCNLLITNILLVISSWPSKIQWLRNKKLSSKTSVCLFALSLFWQLNPWHREDEPDQSQKP